MMRGRPFAAFLIRCIDACLPNSKPCTIAPPRRILLSNLAHLGDVVIATSALAVLKDAYPEAEIGFLYGSWSKELLENHPLITYHHTADHWKANRSSLPLWKKIATYLKTAIRARTEIKKIKYDIAIDLYYYFGNAIPLFWSCCIPVRIGFTSGGFGPLLTHRVDRIDQDKHLSLYYLELLKMLPRAEESFAKLKPILAPISEKAKASLIAKLPPGAWEKGYFVFHMGAGWERRCWEEQKWREVALSQEGRTIIFTGKGKKDQERIERVIKGIPNAMSFCDQITFAEFAFLIESTQLLVSVNSLPPHIASVYNSPTLVIFCGINQISEWKANHARCRLLMEPVPCAPCYNQRGCVSMQCIRGITAERVCQEIKKINAT